MAKRKTDKKSQPGRLRIVAGNWRSRLLEIADVPSLRPTSARIRETLFNWLAPTIAGSRCLDLCAGTGALGFEALSRGAANCVFVEPARLAVRALQANARLLGATTAEIRETSAQQFLRSYQGPPFDVVFLDPPFADDLLPDLCRLLGEGEILASGARIYVEADRNQPDPALPAHWQELKSGQAGNVRYSLLTASDED